MYYIVHKHVYKKTLLTAPNTCRISVWHSRHHKWARWGPETRV